MKAYIAAGWFTPEQEQARVRMLATVRISGMDYYSPKDHGLYIKGVTKPSEVFGRNIQEILSSDLLVVSTVGKDMGTVFECGCAFILKIPIIYFWESKDPLNLMLSESAHYVARDVVELLYYLQTTVATGVIGRKSYKGEIE